MRLLFTLLLLFPVRLLLAQCTPPVTIAPIPRLCSGNPSHQLSATPAGGVWSGPNISPGGLIALPGMNGFFTATYIYSDSSCTDTVQAGFQVISGPSLSAGTDFSIVCGGTPRVNGAYTPGPNRYAYWSTPDGNLLDPPTDMNGRVSEPGTYILTAIDTTVGCPSRDTTICYPNLTSYPHTLIVDTICQGDSLLGYTVSGNYYTKYAIDGPCDSFRVVRLTVLQPLRDTLAAVICAGENVDGYTQSGIYTDTLPATSGCDSIRTLQLTVLPMFDTQISLSTCDPAQAGIFTAVFTAANGCDSTVTTTVTLLTGATSQIQQTICAGQNFEGYTQSGLYPDTFPAANGCDSIRALQLTVLPIFDTQISLSTCDPALAGIFTAVFTAINGCDSTVTTTVTLLTGATSQIQQTICTGQNFEGYTQSGLYTDTFPAANGCDSIRTLQLTVLPTFDIQISLNTCDPAQAGIFTAVFTAINGCDSTVTTTITLLPGATSQIQQTICPGQNFEGYTQSGLYTDTFPAANGCDSIRVLQLTVLPTFDTQISLNTCDPAQTGVFTAVYQAANGCDSTVTTTITLLPGATSQIQQTICAGQNFEGYTQSGLYPDTFPAANGCDSIRTLQLTVLPTFDIQISLNTCDPAQAGIFTAVFTAENGCDSTVTTTVTLLPGASSQIQQMICAGQSFEGYTQSGLYTDTFPAANGCDSIRMLQLTVQPLPAATADIDPDKGTANGAIELVSLGGVLPIQLAWSTGDSAATLTGLAAGDYTLTLTDATGCSAVLVFTVPLVVGASDAGDQTLRLSAAPNPLRAGRPVQIRLQTPGSGAFSVLVFTATGRLLRRLEKEHNGDQTVFPLDFPMAGVYIVQVMDERGGRGVLRVVVW
jgi:hypothetical protein